MEIVGQFRHYRLGIVWLLLFINVNFASAGISYNAALYPLLAQETSPRFLSLGGCAITQITGAEMIFYSPAGLQFYQNSAGLIYPEGFLKLETPNSSTLENDQRGWSGMIGSLKWGYGFTYWTWSAGIGYCSHGLDAPYVKIGDLNAPEQTGIVEYNDQSISFAIATALRNRLKVGITWHILNTDFAGRHANGNALDGGLQYDIFPTNHYLRATAGILYRWQGDKKWSHLSKQETAPFHYIVLGYHIGINDRLKPFGINLGLYKPTLFSEFLFEQTSDYSFLPREVGLGTEVHLPLEDKIGWERTKAGLAFRFGMRTKRWKINDFPDESLEGSDTSFRSGVGLYTEMEKLLLRLDMGIVVADNSEFNLYKNQWMIALIVSPK